MPSTYHLQPDEWVVTRSEMGAYLGSRPAMRTSQTEIVLTSRNIIVVSLGMTRKPKGVRYFPLDQIRVIGGRPQVFTAGMYPRNLLEVHFHDGQESFGFSTKREVQAWTDSITKLMTGRSDEIGTTTDLSSNGMAGVGEPWKHTVDMLKTSFGLASGSGRGAATAALDRVARKCTSCSAPLSGIAGHVVRCEYCQSDQQL